MEKYNIIVTSASGVEGVTKKELKALNVADPKAIDGSFRFSGSALDIARLNMFLRTAERVYIGVDEFSAATFDELYDKTADIEWENFLDYDGIFNVNGKSKNSALFSIRSCQSIIKKAIISRLAKVSGKNTFPESGARFFIDFAIDNDRVTLSLNTSGKGLHKRGYRDLVSDAPIKETLACALLMLSDMNADNAFIDPFCGSGTIVIEGARMALNIASGRDRDFDYMYWNKFNKTVYGLAKDEALSTEILNKNLRFEGYDIDPAAIKLSLRHAQRAGVSDSVHLQVRDVKDLRSRFSRGVIVTNPPYGERLMNPKEVNKLYETFGKAFAEMEDWSAFVITGAAFFERYFGRKCDKQRKLFNAEKECRLYSYLKKQPNLR